jgi:hypothetical protein
VAFVVSIFVCVERKVPFKVRVRAVCQAKEKPKPKPKRNFALAFADFGKAARSLWEFPEHAS